MRLVMCLLMFLVLSFSDVIAGSVNDNRAVICDTVSCERTFDYFYHQALSKREAGLYDEAFDLFEHCLLLAPNSPIVQSELYSMYLYLGRKDEAINMIKNAAAGDSDNYWYRSMLASAYENIGNREEAKNTYLDMVKDFSSRSELYYVLAQMYIEDAEYNKAIEALNDIERIEGKNEDITLKKYELYIYLQERERAVNELQQLLDEYPEDLNVKVLIGDTFLEFGDTEKALNIYESVLEAEPDNAKAQIALAEYYNMQGNDSLYTASMERLFTNSNFIGDERSRALIKYVAMKERTDSTSYNMPFLERVANLPYEQAPNNEIYANYLMMKEVSNDTLVPVLETILRYEPENRFAQLQLLKIAIEQNDYDKVIQRCDTAILYNPEIMELYYYRGIACYNKDMYPEAIATLRKAIDVRSQDYNDEFVSDMYSIIGDVYHSMGNNRACVEAYDSALVYNSSNISVLNNYAYNITVDGGDLEKAEDMSYRTIKAEPENITYLDTYMWILFKQGRYSEAKAYAEKLLSIETDGLDKVLLHHCGDVFAKCGEMERALELWQLAVDAGDDSKILKKKIKRKKYYSDGKKR